MSTEIKTIKSKSSPRLDVDTTQFFGGDRGTCIQLTQGGRFIQLDRSQIVDLIRTLDDWELDFKESE